MADEDTTLVVYMGAASMAHIAVCLIRNGLPSATPAMAVSQGTTRNQRQVVSTLGEVADAVADADLPSPILFIVGRVVTLADGLAREAAHEVVDFDRASARHA